jgi:hypothetical protein
MICPGFQKGIQLTSERHFIAGEAVKEAVSPDGKTLAILTAGMNSLYDSNGNVDTAASTQVLFCTTFQAQIRSTRKQVIQQPNAHAGLVAQTVRALHRGVDLAGSHHPPVSIR